jgi:hypothetical protein
MQYLKQLAVAAGILTVLSVSAWAEAPQAKHKSSITLSEPVQVGSTQLKPGEYKLQWQGDGPDVQVAFVLNGKTVATVPAKLVDKTVAANSNAVVLKPGNGSTKSLDEIDFSGKKQALVIGGAGE